MKIIWVKVDRIKWNLAIHYCDDNIINIDSEYPNLQEEFYIRYLNGKVSTLLRYGEIDYNGILILWSKNFDKTLQNELHKFILSKVLTKKTYFKMSIQLLLEQDKYISFFQEMGFTEELYLREHIKIQNKYLDAIILSLDNEVVG